MATESNAEISLHLSRHLSLEGYNAENTTYHKNSAVCHNTFMTMISYTDGTAHYYTAGSKAEGTEITESDQDAMISIRGIEILNKDGYVDTDRMVRFVRETQINSPGYVKLYPSIFNKNLDHPFLKITFQDLLINHENNRYLSSEKFRMEMLKIQNVVPLRNVLHGPCVMSEIDSLYADEFTNSNLESKERDFAFAIPCREWPEEANEWKMRRRRHGWPSDSMISKIGRKICHVVAVGNAGSDDCSIQWRQSFLLSERSLVWSFNDVQIQCYVVVKQIVKSILEPMAPNQISSYNIKTILFWMSEEMGTEQWKPTNLLACVCLCLNRLAVCIENKSLPHYFMKKANLFRFKFSIAKQSENLILTIQKILRQVVDYTLKSGLCKKSEIGKVYETCGGNLKLFESRAKSISELTTRYKNRLSYHQSIRKFRAIFVILKRFTFSYFTRMIRPEDAKSSLEFLLNMQDCEPETFSRIGAYIEIRKGFTALSQKYTEAKDDEEKKNLDQMALKCFQTGLKLDVMSGPLYLATYYLEKGDVENCLKTIEEMMDKLPKQMIYIGFTSADECIGFENGKFIPIKTLKDNGADETMPAVFDMLFTKDDFVCLPPYLVGPCILLSDFGDRYLPIHPCVYTLFLRHYATCIWEGTSHEKTMTTFDQLEVFIKEHNYRPPAFNSFTLLALCCFGINRNADGMEHLITSLVMSSRMPNVRNAAIYWVTIFLYQLWIDSVQNPNSF